MKNEAKISDKLIELQHHKNQVVRYQEKLYRCVCCDWEYATFARILYLKWTKEEPSHWRTKLDALFLVSNEMNIKSFDYEIYHDDFFVMIEEEEQKADSTV